MLASLTGADNGMDEKEIPVYDVAQFAALLEENPDVLSSHPCVVTGFVEKWAAAKSWLEIDRLKGLFGNLPVTAGAPQFTTNKHDRMCQVQTDYGTYLDYVRDPTRIAELFPAPWKKGCLEDMQAMGLPLYCGNLRLVRHASEAVLAYIRPLVPDGLECLNDQIPYFYQSGNHVWLYVSKAGALTPLHQDNNAVIACLAQLKGRKQARLYAPEDRACFYTADIGYMNPLNPGELEFPNWRRARPWSASLEPGQLLIWGANWAHHVITCEDSITVSVDIVNSTNLGAYARSFDWQQELGHFAKRNEALIRGRSDDAQLSAALDVGEEAPIGRAFMRATLQAALASSQQPTMQSVRERLLRALEAG